MSQTASKEALKLKKLLSELFQLDDAASLDFGIYRILAQRRDEMERFLNELVSGIPARLAEAAGGERERLQAELDAYVRRRQEDGDDLADIRGSKRYKELSDKVEASVDVRELARDVFRDLHAFFSRYWDEGDFMAVPRYDRDTYAIPYDGSEVALHWANRDQYYVKSTVFFNDMTVRDPSWPGSLKFELAAAVTDRDNAKGADANKRRFSLAQDDAPVREEGKNLVVRLRYGPWSEAEDAADEGEDTDEESGDETEGGEDSGAGKKARTLRQDKLDELTALRILELAPSAWQFALRREVRREGEKKGQSEMLRRLRRYTKGNTADFFIHKNLRKFLRRELDFFIKNEVFDLDNIDRADVATLDAKLKRVRALRGLAHDLIDWLHQIEDFQRRLFLKKKFVLRTDWAVTLDRVPKELWSEIATNEAQVQRWKNLLLIDEIPGDMFAQEGRDAVLDTEFLSRNPYLPVETVLLPAELRERVIAAVANDDDTCGTLIMGESTQAIRMIGPRWRGAIGCEYLDPPYNTDNDTFLYKDGLRHSTWATAVGEVLRLSAQLLVDSGVMFCSIDDNEFARLSMIANYHLGDVNVHPPFIWKRKAGGGDDSEHLAAEHEYVLTMSKRSEEMALNRIEHESEAMTAKYNREENGRRYYLERLDKTSLTYSEEMDFAIECPDGTRIKPPQPDPSRPTTIWRWGKKTVVERRDELEFLREKKTGEWRIYTRTWEPDQRGVTPRSLLVDKEHGRNRDGTTEIAAMFGSKVFKNPKPTKLLQHLLGIGTGDGSVVLDCYGGSGTTGHSVINLNRDPGGRRAFILVEMGEHFDTVLVPRILKATYSKDWKEGKPVDRKGLSALYKFIRLESYDDTLENIALDRPDDRQAALFGAGGGTTGVGKDYLLRYMLHMEAGRSLLDKERFAAPFDYRIRALVTKRDEQGASWSAVEETPVDLVETFNYLLGLRVKTMQPLGRDGDMAGARYVEGVRRDSRGDWSIKVLVVWRDCTKVDDQVLDELFARAQFTEAGADGRRYIADFDEVYVNGDNRLPNQCLDGERWKVTLIEEEFHRLMFDVPDEE